MPTEADTCRKFVVPKLQAAGWDTDPHSIAEQRSFTDGRIVVRGNKAERKKKKRADWQNRSVPRASIIWLARAVNVVRPAARRLHIDCARFAKGRHLGNTLGVCMSGFKTHRQFQIISKCCLRQKTI